MSEEILQGGAGMWVYETAGLGEGGPEHDVQHAIVSDTVYKAFFFFFIETSSVSHSTFER